MYTYFCPGTNWVIGGVMHIRPLFFTGIDQQTNMMHEMGRFYNSLGEDNTGTWHDVRKWDNILESLCSLYGYITKKYAKDGGASNGGNTATPH
jgi:hypothetical protein